tara:strand:- start:3076 stop:5454 length:2379 start_codon:yes stop_codon:yes gene_type:complete
MGKSVGYLKILFGADLRGFNKAMSKAQRSIRKFGASMKKTGANLTRNVTLPIIALGAVSIKTFATFEQSMLKVKAVSGATAKEFETLKNQAKELGASTMFTASEVAGLQFELSKLGQTPKQINKSTQSILNLAQATSTDLSEASKTVAVALNSYNLEADQAARISDIMALASSSAAIDMEKLGSALPKVAATARISGDSFELMTSKLQVLADSGLEGARMGTQLKIIYSKLASSGLSWDEAMNKLRNSTDKIATAQKIFGENAFNAAIILSESKDKLNEYEKANLNATGTAQKLADIMDSGTSGAFRRLKSALEGLAIDLGGMLIPLLEDLMKIIKKGISSWKGLDRETKNTIVAFGLIAASIGPIISALGFLAGALAFLFSPIGLVVAALVGGAILIWYYWDDIKVLIVDVTNYIINLYNESELFRGSIQMLSAGFQNMWQVAKFSFKALWEIVKWVTGQIGAAFTGVQRIIDGAFSRSPKKILFGIASLTKTLNENSKEAFKNITEDALSASKELEKILISTLVKTIKRPNIELISEEDIDRGLDKIDDFAKEVLAKLKAALGLTGGGGGGEKEEVSNVTPLPIVTSIGGPNLPIEGGFWDLYVKGIEKVNEKLKETKSLMEVLSDTFGLNEEVLKGFGEQLGSTFMQGADSMKEFAKTAKNSIRETIGAVLALGVANAIQKAMEGMAAFPGSVFLIPAIAGLAGGLAKTAFNSLIPSFADGGIVSGPTVGLMGEYPGAKSNPEVIAPLDKLKKYMNNAGNQSIEVFGRISGNDIFISNQRGSINRLRSV